MAINLVRYDSGHGPNWGVARDGRIEPLEGEYATTAALIGNGSADLRAAAQRDGKLPIASVRLLSPVTAPARIICQGANYRQHMIESGLDPDVKTFNMFFEKADCTLNSPVGEVRKPAHVSLLDYEVELALVFAKPIQGPVKVTAANLHEYVFGITVANDVSARDVQLPQMQFFKGKSYRGFCPVGPFLTVLEPSEFACLDALELHLAVNGATRQRDNTANLVYKPAETITELSTFSDIAPGDVLLTGTPSGCALRVPPPMVRRLMQFVLPERRFWATFRNVQSRRPEYLKAGDIVTARINTADRAIDLGEQRITITA